MGTPALLSWSGGKDAAWALHTLRAAGDFDVVGLLTTVVAEGGPASMQGVTGEVLHAQATAARLPLIEVPVAPGADNSRYEAALATALAAARLRWPGIGHLAFGDLALEDIRAWRTALCARLGWQALFPLFGADTNTLARTMLAGGLRATLCCVDTVQLAAGFAGRAYDASLLDALPAGVDPCGENGEFHTVVHAGPMFATPLHLRRGASTLDQNRFQRTGFTVAG
ncbi:ATP-binding protein [Luteimonas yindakuii]|uniref:Dph6-related ATP pyrophosphatase n=1 Tax=Luteimonas yindakuii TaxID=2565782 RepID=UPI0010A2EA47|nr:ATP-binding protein [Luteimonas yindakuii]QCO66819.1 ATP-binding protein [Luteimonas yindakuii]